MSKMAGDQEASYADALWARHAKERLRDEPKERLRRRLVIKGNHLVFEFHRRLF